MAKQRKVEAKITADNKQFKRGVSEAERQTQGFGKSINGLKSRLKMLAGAAAIGAVVKGLFDMAKQVAENADRLLDLEQQTGLTTDTLQEYEHVARVAGVNSETMANAVMGLTQRLARGAEMSAGLRMGLDALNIAVFDSSGKMRDLGKVSEEAIVQLAEMEDITQRNVIGAQLFSGAWKNLAPIMALGKDGIEAAKKEARELGLVMSKESLVAANDFRVEMETMGAQFQQLKYDIGISVIPALKSLIKYTNEAWQGFKNLFGIGDRGMGGMPTAQNEVEKFLQTIEHITDEEDRRAKIVEHILYLQQKSSELWNSKNKSLIKTGDLMREEAKYLQENIDKYAQIQKKNDEIHSEQVRQLGDIERLEAELAEEKSAYNQANSDQQRAMHTMRMTQIQNEIDKLNELAQAGAQSNISAYLEGRGMSGLGEVQSLGAMLTDGHEETLRKLAETDIALKNISKSSKDLSIDLQQVEFMAYEVGSAFGNAFGRMVSEGRDATQEIIKQMLAQVVAALIKASVSQLGLAGIALGAAAPGIAHGLFSMIPSYATGTSNHPGGMALVGERGPELVNLPRGSSVYTNSE